MSIRGPVYFILLTALSGQVNASESSCNLLSYKGLKLYGVPVTSAPSSGSNVPSSA
jgi:hypothetical protein